MPTKLQQLQHLYLLSGQLNATERLNPTFPNQEGGESRRVAAQPRRRLIPGVGDASKARGERGDFVKTLQCSDCSPGAHFPPQCPTNDMFVCNTICFLFLFLLLIPSSKPLHSSSSSSSSSEGDTSKAPCKSTAKGLRRRFHFNPLTASIHKATRPSTTKTHQHRIKRHPLVTSLSYLHQRAEFAPKTRTQEGGNC